MVKNISRKKNVMILVLASICLCQAVSSKLDRNLIDTMRDDISSLNDENIQLKDDVSLANANTRDAYIEVSKLKQELAYYQ